MHRRFFARHGFTVFLALGLVLFELGMMLILLFSHAPGYRWLGNTVQVPNDTAVYLAEIGQGSWMLHNPYVAEPHAARFDLVWSTLSMVYRATNLSPIVIHEAARILFTVFLVFVLHATARAVAKDEQEARLGTLLMVGGVGLGWLHAAILGANGLWTPTTDAAPDLTKEFAVIPTLMGGAHTILSVALLVFIMRGIWDVVHDRTRKPWSVMTAILALTAFHPYFIPLVASIISMAWTKKLSRPAKPGPASPEPVHANALLLALALLPSLVGYILLARDPSFSQHHFDVNVVPLASWDRWLFVLAPSIVAVSWTVRRHHQFRQFFDRSRWCIAWLFASLVLFILPVPWTGKFVEGLMIPLVLIALPAWSALFRTFDRVGAMLLLAFILGATPLFFISSQAKWLSHPENASWFSRPESVFHAWTYLKTIPNAVVTTDEMWLNVWTPAWSGRTVWVGHHHETPNYVRKQRDWATLVTTTNPLEAERVLASAPVTHLLLTSRENTARLRAVIGDRWTAVFEEGEVTILENKNSKFKTEKNTNFEF